MTTDDELCGYCAALRDDEPIANGWCVCPVALRFHDLTWEARELVLWVENTEPIYIKGRASALKGRRPMGAVIEARDELRSIDRDEPFKPTSADMYAAAEWLKHSLSED